MRQKAIYWQDSDLDRFHQSILVYHIHATFYVQVSAASRSIQHHLSSRIPQCSKKRTWIIDNICSELFLLRLHEYSLSLLSAQQVLSVSPASLQVLVVGEHLSLLSFWLMTWPCTTTLTPGQFSKVIPARHRFLLRITPVLHTTDSNTSAHVSPGINFPSRAVLHKAENCPHPTEGMVNEWLCGISLQSWPTKLFFLGKS